MDKTNKVFRLSLIGFNETQTTTFSAVLSLAERALRDSWYITERDDADFFILAIEKCEADALITLKNLPRERCLFCTVEIRPEFDYEHDILYIATGGLPQLSSLVKVLNYQAAHINFSESVSADNSSTTLIVTSNVVSSNNSNDFFNPNRNFLKLLLQNTEDFLIFRFSSPTSSRLLNLYVDGKKKNYYCEASLKELKSYFTIKDAVIVDTLSAVEGHDSVEQFALPLHPLANLIWYVAFELSNGRLLLGHSNEDNVYLTRWPDLGIEGCGKYIKLAAFMRNNITSLSVVASKTNVPLPEVYNFYNACYLIGIVEKADKPELYAKTLDEDKQKTLAKITRRLEEINNIKGETK